MNKLIEFFKHKGVIATWIGIAFTVPVNIIIIRYMLKDIEPERSRLIWAAALNFIGMIWFILPSKIEIISKLFTVKLED